LFPRFYVCNFQGGAEDDGVPQKNGGAMRIHDGRFRGSVNAWPAEVWPSTEIVMESRIRWLRPRLAALFGREARRLIHVHLMPEQIGNAR
jgi:hypothetical protein